MNYLCILNINFVKIFFILLTIALAECFLRGNPKRKITTLENHNRLLQDKDKFGFIFLHDQSSTYDKNFYDAAVDVCEEFNVEPVIRINIAENEACYNTSKELAEMGCKGIFGDSFGFEDYLIKAAKEYNSVEFGHATGTKAHTENLNNYHNAFASIYEGRYVTGIAAGMKLNEMIEKGNITESEAIVGYIGAFPYAEVVSGYTSFFLGVKSVCDSAKMVVRYTNSWYDGEGERKAAEQLIDEDGCKIISQHADSQGAPSVCESKGVPNVFYNGENTSQKNSYLTSSRINWRPYFRYFINSTLNGVKMEYDWVGNLSNGAVELYNASNIAAEGTQDAMNKAIEDLKEGKIKVFNTSKFTVSNTVDGLVVDENNHVTSYKADVNTDSNNEGDTEVISNGYFHESEYRSSPYFDIRIDGITEIFDNDSNSSSQTDSISNRSGNTTVYRKGSNKGLSKGAICAIVIIPALAILSVIGVVFVCNKRNVTAPMINKQFVPYPDYYNNSIVAFNRYQPYLQANNQPVIQPNINNNIQTNIQPVIQPNVQSDIQPNI